MEKYKECYVAFIDILGFKNLIDKSNFEDIYSIFLLVLNFEPHPLLKNEDVYKDIHYTIMSDSIIIYIDVTITDGFMALTDVCSQIQMKLSRNNPPFFVRGGIAKGTLYHHNNILFGTGLTNAYILENTSAIYPRIIFTEKLRQLALENTKKFYIFDYNSMFYKKDNDEMYYINFLHAFNYIPTVAPKSVEESIQVNNKYFHTLLGHVNEVLGTEIDQSIRKKYLWLKNKIMEEIECMPEVKKYFDELHCEENEKLEKRLSKTIIEYAKKSDSYS